MDRIGSSQEKWTHVQLWYVQSGYLMSIVW